MKKALSLAYRYLSFRPRTIAETKKYLTQKAEKYTLSAGEIDAAVELLKDQGYLNDAAFIESFVNSRNLLRPKGKKALEMELRRLGISQEDCDEYFSKKSLDENNLAQTALKKKMKSLLSLSDEKRRYQKALSFLQRRGFSYDVAKQAYLQLTQ